MDDIASLLGLPDLPPARWAWATSADYSAEGDALGDPAAPDFGRSGVRHVGPIGGRSRLPAVVPMPHLRLQPRDWKVQCCSAKTGVGVGDGLDWLVASLKRTIG